MVLSCCVFTCVCCLQADKPFFGICLGMQLLFDGSDESGGHEGLGIIKGKVRVFDKVITNYWCVDICYMRTAQHDCRRLVFAGRVVHRTGAGFGMRSGWTREFKQSSRLVAQIHTTWGSTLLASWPILAPMLVCKSSPQLFCPIFIAPLPPGW